MDVIVGVGKTGVSCARHLAAKGLAFRLADDAPAPAGFAEILQFAPGVTCRSLAEAGLTEARRLIVSPGVSLAREEIRPALFAGAQVTGDVALFCNEIDAPLLAITGSNGKSTVTTLLGRMAEHAGKRAAVGGNLGTPCLDLLGDGVDVYVIEMSSFQLETARAPGADVAVLLNVTPDHMDRYPDFETYRATKAHVFGNCRAAVIARDAPIAELPECELWTFGADAAYGRREAGLHPNGQLLLGGEAVLRADQLKVVGSHNHLNVLAALAAGCAAGFDLTSMVEAALNFPGLPHRTEWVADIDGVGFFNDSKATNPGATLAAVRGFAGHPLRLLMGGQGKGADFEALGRELASADVQVYVFGEDAAELQRALGQDVVRVATMLEALDAAHRSAEPGDVVLLSPACASFDEFSGFAERGERFARTVREAADG